MPRKNKSVKDVQVKTKKRISPTEYKKWLKDESLEALSAWARQGLTQEEIALKMGISLTTLKAWRKKYPQLNDCLTHARAYADARVENSLYCRAVGYTITVREPMKVKRAVKDDTGRTIGMEEIIEYTEKQVHMPPDTKAIEMWLTNRDPANWRKQPVTIDNTEHETGGIVLLAAVEETPTDDQGETVQFEQ